MISFVTMDIPLEKMGLLIFLTTTKHK